MNSPTRYRLRGRLETASPLHLGSGETVERPGLMVEGTGKAAEVAGVAVDHGQRPYLPGTALKGVLRNWSERHGIDAGLVEGLFGSQERGGGAVFLDAPMEAGEPPSLPPPYWCTKRHTGVVSRVAIDRRRHTASHQRLFHQEMVPACVSFRVEVVAESVGDAAPAVLLAAFAAFEDDPDLALGARTTDGWGRMAWHFDALERLGEAEVRAWLATGAVGMASTAYQTLPSAELDALLARSRTWETRDGAALGVELELCFDAPFLVNDTDPEHVGPGEDKPDGMPRRDHRGRVLLPASSLRGALRGRAERILRTLGGDGAACGPDAPRPPCGAVEDAAGILKLCPACRVFGAAGWRAPLHIGDFVTAEPVPEDELLHQHFVAVDRFTGGAAHQRKFDVRAAWAPTLSGRLRLDLAALERAGVEGWGIALLVLVLRDLTEGDLVLGAGGAHGYGSCQARVTAFEPPASWATGPEGFRDLLAPLTEHLEAPASWPRRESPLGAALSSWAKELGTVAADGGKQYSAPRYSPPEGTMGER